MSDIISSWVYLIVTYVNILSVLAGRWDDYTTTPTTTPPPPFFSDKTNMLVYVILPLFILIVGGSILLYSVHKIRKSYAKRKDKHKRETQVAPQRYEKPPATILMTVMVDGKKTLRAIPW